MPRAGKETAKIQSLAMGRHGPGRSPPSTRLASESIAASWGPKTSVTRSRVPTGRNSAICGPATSVRISPRRAGQDYAKGSKLRSTAGAHRPCQPRCRRRRTARPSPRATLTSRPGNVFARLDRRRGLAIEYMRFANETHAVLGRLGMAISTTSIFKPTGILANSVFEAPGEHKITDLEWCETLEMDRAE